MKDLMSIQTNWILPFQSDEAVLALVGGKGANLARLTRAGFPVPPGFFVTTRAYLAFVEANQLQATIQAALSPDAGEDLQFLEAASNRIREAFSNASMPPGLADELLSAYHNLGRPAVAVRSSATAEDLPDLSFAGQQDTYLNVFGDAAFLKAVVNCWSSLWTARATGYRARNHVPHAGVALAVVVQRMVESQASGVLFTANPLTGLRSETVIDATIGLGEALVSGQVVPDHYRVDTTQAKIITKKLGAKAISIRGLAGGGTAVQAEAAGAFEALPDEQILALAGLGQRVQSEYGFPQDIEWAWANDQLYLLQSRPITSLFPVPERTAADPLEVFFSFAAIQGLLDPLTPLGDDVLRNLAAMVAIKFGYKVNSDTQTVFYSAAGRIWVNVTALILNTTGRKVVPVALASVEPTIGQALEQIWDDPRLQPEKPGIRPRTLRRMAGFFGPLLGNVLLNLIAPDRRREFIIANGERTLAKLRAMSAAIPAELPEEDAVQRSQRLLRRAALFSDLADQTLTHTLILFVSGVVAGVASLNVLNQSVGALPEDAVKNGGWHERVLKVTRGLPHNPTTEMDLALWETSQAIRHDPSSLAAFQNHSPQDLAKLFLKGELPEAAQNAAQQFLDKYGSRGLAEIDTGRERWRENPTHIFEVIHSYLMMDDPERAPDVVFRRGAETAQAVIANLAAEARKTRAGWLKAARIRLAAGRVRSLLGMREAPKFFAIRMMDIVRQALLESGREFYAAGELDQPDDLFYLSLSEIKIFALGPAQPGGRNWKDLIATRRANYQRERLRRQVPRLLLSDGRAFYEGMAEPASMSGEDHQPVNGFTGSPVSPGSVEGSVRVVFDPREAHLQPGEILVCPGTDPSWTPLFLSAAGLVMEVGGLMTHGAVVAREYGLPAIVGVDQATQRLKTGQRVRINGSTGQITLLSD